MSRSNLEDNRGERLNILSMLLGAERSILSGNVEIPANGPILNFFDAGGSNCNVTLPSLKRGRIHAVINVGASGTLSIRNPSGTELTSIPVGEAAFLVCSGVEWKVLTQSTGDALTPSEVSSPDGSITVATVMDAITLVVDPSNVDHDALANYVANEHVDHSGVALSTAANSGLAGGGTIEASRNLVLDPNNLTAATPVLADILMFGDVSASNAPVKSTFTELNGILDHDALLNYSADRHVAHSGVSINTGSGLSGGGTISATRTINLDLHALTADTPVLADEIFFYDVGGTDYNRVTITNFLTALDIITRTTATGLPDPTNPQDAATKAYVDSVAAGLDPKQSVQVATTANITLSGEQTIDTVLTSASRVLVKNQSSPAQNGIYVSAAGAWTRATDTDTWDELVGAFTFVEAGGQASSGWVTTIATGGTLNTTAVTWTQFSGAGTYTASGGITLAGSNFALTSMAESTFKGRAAGAGTGAPTDLNATQATAILNVFGPDTGSGGVKGLVPATVAGDATKFLRGDGTWAVGGGGGGLADVVDDTTPQLGGNLDANAKNIGFDDNTGITDDSNNEQLWFQKTASAVNFLQITNSATGNKPLLDVDGSDTDIGIKIAPKGTGVVEFGGTAGWVFGGSTANASGWGSFDNTLTIDNVTARERSILEIASNATTVGDTIAALAITNRANTGTGASKLTHLIQWNARSYSGGGTNDFSADMTFSAYRPDINDFEQIFTMGSTDGVGCILIDTEGPHGINTDQNVDVMIYVGGSKHKGDGLTFGGTEIMRFATEVDLIANMSGRGVVLAPRFIEASSGTHPEICSMLIVPPSVTNGAATTTVGVTLHITDAPSISGATNYALWVDAGNSRFDGPISMNTTNKITDLADPTAAQDAATKTYVDTKAGLPQNSKSANYTTVLGDANGHIYHPTSDNNARTFTIDSNANVAYAIGTTLTIINEKNIITLAITSDTLAWYNGTSIQTGSRTLAEGAFVTAVKVTSTRWALTGSGIT